MRVVTIKLIFSVLRLIFGNRACGILYRFVKRNGGCYLLPANVCPVVPLTLQLADVVFQFVDIDLETLCIDERACLELMGSGKYTGLIFVHTYGSQYDPQLFFEQIKTYSPNCRIIDDKCLCFPDLSFRRTVADLTLFSTGYAKCVDLGKGGFGFIQDGIELSLDPLPFAGNQIDSIYKEAFNLKTKIRQSPLGWLDAHVSFQYDKKYCQRVVEEVKRMKEHKRIINTIYQKNLDSLYSLNKNFNQWRYNILVDNKLIVLRELFAAGFFASSHYQPSSLLYVDDTFPNAEYLYEHIINLFNDKYIDYRTASRLALLIQHTAISHF